jgi:hypothetical protein
MFPPWVTRTNFHIKIGRDRNNKLHPKLGVPDWRTAIGRQHAHVRNGAGKKNAVHGFAGRKGIATKQSLARGIGDISLDVNCVAHHRRRAWRKRLNPHVAKIGGQVQSHSVGDAQFTGAIDGGVRGGCRVLRPKAARKQKAHNRAQPCRRAGEPAIPPSWCSTQIVGRATHERNPNFAPRPDDHWSLRALTSRNAAALRSRTYRLGSLRCNSSNVRITL